MHGVAISSMYKIINNKHIRFYLAVIIISLTLNWLVQLFYYILMTSRNPQAFLGQKTLLEYWTGVLGDGVIAPIINVFVFFFFTTLHLKPQKKIVIKMFALALLTDILVHFLQGKLGLVNWSMPKPFAWNFAGYWHMISLPIQMTYLYLFFYSVIASKDRIKHNVFLIKLVLGVLGLMLLFVVLFLFDNGWI